MTDIFVSYAREDKEKVRPLVELLEKQGWQVWWDLELRSGQVFHDVIAGRLASARCVIVAWSRNSVGSHWVRDEASEGTKGNRLVPVSLDGELPPLGFRGYHTTDLSSWFEDRDTRTVVEAVDAVNEVLQDIQPEDLETMRAKWQESAAKIQVRSRYGRPLAFAAPSAVAIAVVIYVSYINRPESIYQPIPPQVDARPSFDCTDYFSNFPARNGKWRMPQSDILCHDKAAADADRTMGQSYKKVRAALKTKVEKDELRDDQTAWRQNFRDVRCQTSFDAIEQFFGYDRKEVQRVAECLRHESDLRNKVLAQRLEVLTAANRNQATSQ